jgi:hypothetical protein
MKDIPLFLFFLIVSNNYMYADTLSLGCSAGWDFPQCMEASISARLPVWQSRNTATDTAGCNNIKTRSLNFGLHLDMRSVIDNRNEIGLNAEVCWIRHSKTKFYIGEARDIGILRTIYHGTTYSVNGNGVISTCSMGGRLYASSGLTTILGWTTGFACQYFPHDIELRPHLWIAYPWNNFILPHISIDFAVRYPVKTGRLL